MASLLNPPKTSTSTSDRIAQILSGKNFYSILYTGLSIFFFLALALFSFYSCFISFSIDFFVLIGLLFWAKIGLKKVLRSDKTSELQVNRARTKSKLSIFYELVFQNCFKLPCETIIWHTLKLK